MPNTPVGKLEIYHIYKLNIDADKVVGIITATFLGYAYKDEGTDLLFNIGTFSIYDHIEFEDLGNDEFYNPPKSARRKKK